MATEQVNQKVYQLRYYNTGNSNNYPKDDEENSWWGQTSDTTAAKNLLTNFGSAVKIGIQTLPGVKFYLNDITTAMPIIIDHTGVYELDLRNTTTSISHLYFDLESLKRINEMDNASIIVDILCNPSQGTVNS